MTNNIRFFTRLMVIFFVSAGSLCFAASDAKTTGYAGAVRVTILSSKLADGATIREWGFSALVEVDGQCVLLDAGFYPEAVLRNSRALNVDLSW